MDDGAFEASQVLPQSTTPDVLRAPWLHTIQSNKPVARLEEAATDREHQLLLESQMVIAESPSLMEQHNYQQAILDSKGGAPMASSAGAVVALSVDLSVGVGGVPRSEPTDDCAEKCFEPELSPTVIPPDDIPSDASDADILPGNVTTPTVPVPTPTPA